VNLGRTRQESGAMPPPLNEIAAFKGTAVFARNETRPPMQNPTLAVQFGKTPDSFAASKRRCTSLISPSGVSACMCACRPENCRKFLESWPGAAGTVQGRWHVTCLAKRCVNISNVRIHAKRFLKNEQARQLSPIGGVATNAFIVVPSATCSVTFSVRRHPSNHLVCRQL